MRQFLPCQEQPLAPDRQSKQRNSKRDRILHLGETSDRQVLRVLTECFRRTAATATVPAFKAETGKPGLSAQPVSWAEAVKSLNLSEQETQRLLQLQD